MARSMVRLRALALLGCIFVGTLFVLSLTYFVSQSRTAQTALMDSQKAQSVLLAESVRTSLVNHTGKMTQDVLQKIAEREGIARITLIGSDGTVQADSEERGMTSKPAPSDWIGTAFARAITGKVVADFPDDLTTQPFLGTVWLPLHPKSTLSGTPPLPSPQGAAHSGVLRITVPLSSGQSPSASLLWFFIKLSGVVGGGIIAYCFLRLLLVPPTPEDDTTGLGVVMGTFQGLLQQLKTKERELNTLKGQAEERAVDAENYSETVLQSVPSGVLSTDVKKRITTFNAAAGNILGLLPKEVLGKPYIRGLPYEEIVSLLDKILDQKNMLLPHECRIKRPDGEWVHVSLNATPLGRRENKALGAVLVISNVTEMRLLQEQIERKRRLAAMGEMSGWIAHQFRNELAVLLTATRLMEKQLPSDDSTQDILKTIDGEISEMEQLITQLLSYGKETVIRPAPVLVNHLLQDMVNQFMYMNQYSHIVWSVDLTLDVPKVMLDTLLMRQVLSNLFMNALEAMPDKGEIEISLRYENDGWIQISIADTGPGIPEQDKAKLFLPFFTTKVKGTGWGLAMAHKVILLHGGTLAIENRTEGGAVTTIRLLTTGTGES